MRKGSIPAVQTGKQSAKTPGGREGAPQPSHPSSPSSLGLQAAFQPTISVLSLCLPSWFPISLVVAPPTISYSFPIISWAFSLLSSPCRNMATCQDGPQGPHCLCPTGYTGSSCQVRGTEPGVIRREGWSSSEKVSGTKRWAAGKFG